MARVDWNIQMPAIYYHKKPAARLARARVNWKEFHLGNPTFTGEAFLARAWIGIGSARTASRSSFAARLARVERFVRLHAPNRPRRPGWLAVMRWPACWSRSVGAPFRVPDRPRAEGRLGMVGERGGVRLDRIAGRDQLQR